MRFAIMLAVFGGATCNAASFQENIWFRLLVLAFGFSLIWMSFTEANKSLDAAVELHELEKAAKTRNGL